MPAKKQKKKNNKKENRIKTYISDEERKLNFKIQMIESRAQDRIAKEKANPTWATSDYRNENDDPFDPHFFINGDSHNGIFIFAAYLLTFAIPLFIGLSS